ncbi:MAG TPA: hypothetical protein VM933_05995 [Acidimicrobiales bacterium]|nr:hypothetical protein [Acidimicrobiales bacterium]
MALALVLVVWRLPDRWYTRFVVEDGYLEWLQVGALVVVLAACVVRARSRGRWWPAWAAAAVVLVVAVGEELAWGSRLFSLAVPSVQASNVQGDLTIHNISGLRGLSKTFGALCVIGVAGAVGCVVLRARVGLALWFGMPAAYAAVRVFDNGPITSRFAKLSEVLELVLYVALARLAVPRSSPVRGALDDEAATATRHRGEDAPVEPGLDIHPITFASRSGHELLGAPDDR